ncbi:receptor-like protein 54 [Gossypium hirsutum]|uniref:Receptor-like protein 54 n=1 Tax=Gossypium hirsutum TaxID=3635 RepID=A0A1U8KI71_GOSHI|nr:receptor-like protein 54 [Gossypium hirsutum]
MVNDSFPYWIEALSELQVLVLRSNRFHGPITAATSPRSLLKLRIVDLSCNNFFVPLPTAVKGFEIELVKILTIFTSIDLSCNNFEGQIPRDIGELSSLRGLSLSHNNLVGHIPSSLRNMTRLEWLDLSSNKLSGQIPTGLLDLTFLSSFNVSCNQLVGPIPKGKQFNTFEYGSYQGNLGLCGVPLSRGCNNNVLGKPPPAPWMNSHEDDGSKLEFGWKVVAIGYGFGFIFRAAMGCGCLRTGVGV